MDLWAGMQGTGIEVRVPSFITFYSAVTADIRILETMLRQALCIDIIPPARRGCPESDYFYSTGWNKLATHNVASSGLRTESPTASVYSQNFRCTSSGSI